MPPHIQYYSMQYSVAMRSGDIIFWGFFIFVRSLGPSSAGRCLHLDDLSRLLVRSQPVFEFLHVFNVFLHFPLLAMRYGVLDWLPNRSQTVSFITSAIALEKSAWSMKLRRKHLILPLARWVVDVARGTPRLLLFPLHLCPIALWRDPAGKLLEPTLVPPSTEKAPRLYCSWF